MENKQKVLVPDTPNNLIGSHAPSVGTGTGGWLKIGSSTGLIKITVIPPIFIFSNTRRACPPRQEGLMLRLALQRRQEQEQKLCLDPPLMKQRLEVDWSPHLHEEQQRRGGRGALGERRRGWLRGHCRFAEVASLWGFPAGSRPNKRDTCTIVRIAVICIEKVVKFDRLRVELPHPPDVSVVQDAFRKATFLRRMARYPTSIESSSCSPPIC